MAQRKLQADIDRVLKLVQQGVTLFEETFDKMTHATNQTSKDKAEADLKTSIKKLQRQRDQIKTWLQSNDIKDKSALMEHRKLIETQMERFKACEKEMKTKAFSKEGLSAQQKLDPKEVAKMEMSHWVSTMVDELGQQIERTEAEVELLRGQTKKKKASGNDGRGSELEALNDRRRWHIGKLELIMRLLENGQISPERVGEVKDDIQYYVESNTEEDFTEDDDLYDSLNLQEEEEQFGMHDDLVSSHDTSSIVEDNNASGDKSPIKEKISITGAQILRGPIARKSTLEAGAVRPTILPGRTGVVSGVVVPPASAPRAQPTTLPSLRYASAAAAAASSATVTSAPAASSNKSPGSLPPTPLRSNSVSASGVPPSTSGNPMVMSPKRQSQQQPSQHPLSTADSLEAKASSPAVPSGDEKSNSPKSENSPVPQDSQSTNGASSASLVQNPSAQSDQSGHSAADQQPVPSVERSPSPSNSQISGNSQPVLENNTPQNAVVSSADAQKSESAQANQVPLPISTELNSTPENSSQDSNQAGLHSHPNAPSGPRELENQALNLAHDSKHVTSLADLVETYEGLKAHEPSMAEMQRVIETGMSGLPQISDAEKPSHYTPRNPYPTSAHYPQQPMAFEKRPSIWSEIEVEVLFYLFYYHQGGYLQYLAAKELKKRAWRFHKYYLTWFQRAKNPEEMADDYEKGSYTYFDWEADWLMRTKTPFQFDYKHLEDTL
ncbi:Not1 N-terminal domain, CCR4-Not complex component-domain-containing protein [Phakopsora pachyrhizi]|uniref:General negative regulator of transcription subunit n=1 Tax=Phakopsora pachyrhizi TaxID=170000 RepID=A0AAV0BHP8_PHAPC|nr:Not1 N-terminal domain, CCR4-Not complex component-domain-containing protein [Phakopsora pachyrhizi]CAH7686079.1 Not1 N-terminal domain, CCR4-Not complex component-domain-containing protein [Phakopsora pachyrhizi]